jgi:hypothetical protein
MGSRGGVRLGWVGLIVGFEVGQLLCNCVQRACTVPWVVRVKGKLVKCVQLESSTSRRCF